MKKNEIISIIFKTIAIISSMAGILLSFYSPTGYMVRFRTFLYFTIDSNFFMALILFIELILIIIEKHKNVFLRDDTFLAFKHMFTLAMVVTPLTFYLMVLFALISPSWGDKAGVINLMLIPSNWTVHLIAPLFSILDYVLFDRLASKNKRRAIKFVSLVYPFMYCVGTIILSLNGVIFSHDGKIVPYFFLDYKTYGFPVMFLFWIIFGIVLYYLNDLLFLLKRKQEEA